MSIFYQIYAVAKLKKKCYFIIYPERPVKAVSAGYERSGGSYGILFNFVANRTCNYLLLFLYH